MKCYHKHLDTEKLKTNLATTKELAQTHANIYKKQATELIHNTKEWATPKAQQTWEKTVKATAPHLTAAAHKGATILETTHKKLVEDYIPKIEALTKEETKMSNKTNKLRNLFLIFTGLVTAAVAGVLVWRRLQPVDDPWAEEYWEDFEEECGEDCECDKEETIEEVAETEK